MATRVRRGRKKKTKEEKPVGLFPSLTGVTKTVSSLVAQATTSKRCRKGRRKTG